MLFLLAAAVVTVTSPDHRIRFELTSSFEFSVTLRGRPVLKRAPLAITIDGANVTAGARAGKPARSTVTQSFAWNGNRSPLESRCNAMSLPVAGKIPHTLEILACNDGVAFRHLVPGGGVRVPDEATAFRVPPASTLWYHDTEGHYEALHVQKRIEDVPAGAWAAPPATFQLPGGGYAAITEGALYHFAGMALQSDGNGELRARLGHAVPPSYPFRLRYAPDVERVSRPAAIDGPITTPWRVVMIGADLNELVNSAMVQSVSPAPDPRLFSQGSATDWIKPGRAVWKYLDGGDNTAETVLEFSRLAGQLGFEYQVVEGFWQKWPPQQLKAVIDESRKHGVGLWLWKHSNQLRDPAARKQFFDLCAAAGASGVKIDFFDHEAKEVVELYETVLREAAERKLLVNFHGANKPAGESRTWPNELTREAVRGMESRKSDRARHDATIPFTRLLAGPADYTPVHLGERRNDTTLAHQVATAVVFTSPLLTYAANPKTLIESPAVEFIKSVPAVWDETRVLPGSQIGEVAVFARRKGDAWFVACVNGTSARRLKIDFSFLGPGEYEALIVRDDEGLTVEQSRLSRASSLAVDLAAGGGYAVRLHRASSLAHRNPMSSYRWLKAAGILK